MKIRNPGFWGPFATVFLLGALCCSPTATPRAQIVGDDSVTAGSVEGTSAEPLGAGVVATLQSDQDVYTNQPPSVWCPPCLTNWPPCLLPCYFIEEETAIARFTFWVKNKNRSPRTFQFSSGQQFDLELVNGSGDVVAAWSDGRFFTQSLTSFTLDHGESRTFLAEIALKDRDAQQLEGTYQARAFLTTAGSEPRVEASTRIAVTLAP
jgi:hypothetical protein